jgi:hypothetical protein
MIDPNWDCGEGAFGTGDEVEEEALLVMEALGCEANIALALDERAYAWGWGGEANNVARSSTGAARGDECEVSSKLMRDPSVWASSAGTEDIL